MHRSALLLTLLTLVALPSAAGGAEFDKYAVESASASLSSTQAGAHANLTLAFKVTKNEKGEPFALTRDVSFKLPPGVIGNPQLFPRCSVEELGDLPEESECPLDSQLGVAEVFLGGQSAGSFFEPVYNMEPPGGDIVARFGFFGGPYPTLINIRIDPIDYSLIGTVKGAAAAAALGGAVTTLWGLPASPLHDGERLTPGEAVNGEFPPTGRKATLPERPFMTNPTDCSTQRQITVTATSYQTPGAPSTLPAPFPRITGCDKLSFAPEFSPIPTNSEAAAPTGLDAELVIPQDETPQGLATSILKSALVTLPEGLVINPAAGDGLAACSATEVGFQTAEASHCPEAAKIGSVEIDAPALERVLKGSVYQRTPEPGHLFRFWLVTDEQGVHLKLPAEIVANPLSGQLTTVFAGVPTLDGLPQLPIRDLKLHVFGGPRAPLATPTACATYQTHYEFAPWSGKPATVGDTPMQISSGCAKGGFSPALAAGTLRSFAGRFSPLSLTLSRSDGEANPQSISLHLPQGLLAKLGGVPLCPEAQAAGGRCPAASQIGAVAAAAGVGLSPLWIPQPGKTPTAIYLAGPYKDAPYSIVAKVPAQAGTFDLGTVVNRSAIYVDPVTALATIKTDPLPQILEGVPIAYRAIHVLVDRPEFTFNPTGCEAKRITAIVTAANGATATPGDSFQVSNCAKLAFSPELSVSLKGGTRRTQHPALHAVLTQKPGQANIAKAVVILPHAEFIDNAHLGNPCTRVQFAAEECPKISVLGTAKAWTPIFENPLKGKIYFRSNGGERELPDVVVDIKGNGVEIIQVGYVDSVNERLRTRFLHFPDAPVTKVLFNLYGGKRGLLQNSANLCDAPRHLKIALGGQNGKHLRSNPRLKSSCPDQGKR
jgi:hypothetical protein